VSALHKKTQVIEFKLRDTVMLGCMALDELGQPVDLTNIDVAAQVRDDAGVLICEMEVEPVVLAEGTYELWAPAEAAWVVGDFGIDVQYTDTSGSRPLIRSSETFYIRMIQDVTQ